MELQGSVAIVTGASKGIGKSIAIHLARQGVTVVLASRNTKELSIVENEITASGGTALSIPTDVTDESSVDALGRDVEQKFGRIDILINNAGVGMFTNVSEMSVEQFDNVMDVNVKGVFLCSRAVLPVMIRQNRGEIINIASLAGKNSFAGGSVYSASKWAVIGFARSLMLEVRNHNIRVVTIAPGSVNTRFADKDRNDLQIIQPEDVAATVHFALTMPDRVNVSEIDIRPTVVKPKK